MSAARCLPVAVPPRADLVSLHRRHPRRYPHLLESAALGPHGRFDILFAFPGETLALHNLADRDFLDALDAAWRASRIAGNGLRPLPFDGGWFVYLGYELAAQVEPKLHLGAGSSDLPLAFATRFRQAIVLDRPAGLAWIVSEDEAAARVETMLRDLKSLGPHEPAVPVAAAWVAEDPEERFLAEVARIHRYIREGDVFQVNLSRAWWGRLAAPTTVPDVYLGLRQHNPGPFAGLATWESWAILSSSPERLVRVAGNVVETRPIAGTRPRHPHPEPDARRRVELLQHPKERAEHVMLIDLERNDLGRICRPGTVEVDELLGVESYAHVHHIVSNVRGGLRDGVTPGQVIRSVFPGGTITGCPKVRCMEIIADLEAVARQSYTGAMGYLNRDGSLDLNILIRTIAVRGDRFSFRTGAGIVADSIAELELAETRAKARGLLLAMGVQ